MFIGNTEIKIVQGDIAAVGAEAMVNLRTGKLIMAGGLEGNSRKELEPGVFNENKVRAVCRFALESARELKIKSLVFPALGCDAEGIPVVASAKIMAQEVLRHIREASTSLKEIIFCLSSREDYEVFQKNSLGYLDYIENKLKSPFLTVDVIIEINGGIVIIKRSNPPLGWALPGGFVDYGESLEEAVIREAKEETNLDITEVRQFHTYSDFDRDPRFHTVGTVFIAEAKGKPFAGDDAADLAVVKLSEIESLEFAFDHKKIIQDYIKAREGLNPF